MMPVFWRMTPHLSALRATTKRRLTQAGTTQYVYDAENHRIDVNGTRFTINSQPALSQVLVKTDADGAQTFYVYGLGLIGEESAAGYKAYHFDFRGSTVALSDESGAVLERFSYSAYGVLLSGDATQTPFLFNGQYGVMTDGNGLYHMRARFYSAEIRRFLNRDVLVGSVASGQSLNRFAFVTGKPVSFMDPWGFEEEPIGIVFYPKFWNRPGIRTITNCYAYALNRPGYHEHPGDQSYFPPLKIPTCSNLIAGAKEDELIDPTNSTTETCGGVCPEGYHKIQIFLDFWYIYPDFHVYRQDEDGSWSHKRGKASYVEGGLSCPLEENRDYDDYNYSDYCGTLCAPSVVVQPYWWLKL